MAIFIFSMGSYICLDTYVGPYVATNSHVEYTKDFGASYLRPELCAYSLPAKGLSLEAWESRANRGEREMKRNRIKEKDKVGRSKENRERGR